MSTVKIVEGGKVQPLHRVWQAAALTPQVGGKRDDSSTAQTFFPCPICSTLFRHKYNIAPHVRSVHYRETVNCPVCGRRVKRLTQHMRDIHEVARPPASCSLCDKLFRTERLLRCHIRNSHGGRHQQAARCVCPVCPAMLPAQKLAFHLEINHFVPADFVVACPLCQKTVKFLPWHVKKVHKGTELRRGDLRHCVKCRRYFESEAALAAHTTNHETYDCQLCGCQFTQLLALSRHLLDDHSKVFSLGGRRGDRPLPTAAGQPPSDWPLYDVPIREVEDTDDPDEENASIEIIINVEGSDKEEEEVEENNCDTDTQCDMTSGTGTDSQGCEIEVSPGTSVEGATQVSSNVRDIVFIVRAEESACGTSVGRGCLEKKYFVEEQQDVPVNVVNGRLVAEMSRAPSTDKRVMKQLLGGTVPRRFAEYQLENYQLAVGQHGDQLLAVDRLVGQQNDDNRPSEHQPGEDRPNEEQRTGDCSEEQQRSVVLPVQPQMANDRLGEQYSEDDELVEQKLAVAWLVEKQLDVARPVDEKLGVALPEQQLALARLMELPQMLPGGRSFSNLQRLGDMNVKIAGGGLADPLIFCFVDDENRLETRVEEVANTDSERDHEDSCLQPEDQDADESDKASCGDEAAHVSVTLAEDWESVDLSGRRIVIEATTSAPHLLEQLPESHSGGIQVTKQLRLNQLFASKKELPRYLKSTSLSKEDELVLLETAQAEAFSDEDLARLQVGQVPEREPLGTRTAKTRHKFAASRQPHLCPYCRQILRTKWSLKQHISVRHFRTKNALCQQCQKSFASRADLCRHMVDVHEQSGLTVRCPECGEEVRSAYLARHRQYRHRQQEPTACGECGKGFAKRENMLKHVRNIHERKLS